MDERGWALVTYLTKALGFGLCMEWVSDSDLWLANLYDPKADRELSAFGEDLFTALDDVAHQMISDIDARLAAR